ncbi:MAG: hypothetical protein Q8M98_08205 [Candidatus Cloacimonadaceae bacterium]|nr:hypothetical protein [Candidatus Cloacimonadaceae bacterium]
MKTEPNMNVILLLTQELIGSNEERLIFLYRKPINDFCKNDDVYWFWKGKAHRLSGQLSINQHVAFCNDKEAEAIFYSIINKTPVDINGNDVTFQVPNVTRKEMQDSNLILSSVSYFCDVSDYFPIELRIEENWNLLCGYASEDTDFIKPIGILTPLQYLTYIQSNQIAINLQRQKDISFRGVHTASVKGQGSKQIIGFVQESFDNNKKYTIKITNDEDEYKGEGAINTSSGLFIADLNDFIASGNLYYYINEKLERCISFTLIQDVVLNMNIISNTMIDAYGRSFHRTNKV